MKIIIDVTETTLNQLNTGIQRVVREVTRNAPKIEQKYDVKIIPVIAQYDGNLYELKNRQLLLNPIPLKYHASILKHAIRFFFRMLPIAHTLSLSIVSLFKRFFPEKNKKKLNLNTIVIPDVGDILIILDSFWITGKIINAANKFRLNGGLVFPLIYDLIPITHPQFIANQENVRIFRNRLIDILNISHGVISISKAAADEVIQFIAKMEIPNSKILPVQYFHLGADFESKLKNADEPVRDWPEMLWDDSSSVFMMVGTIEPRKGHAFVLEVFESRWKLGLKDKLLIIGRVGWSSESLVNHFIKSKYYNSFLFIINDATDVDLEYAYAHVYACIIASYAEGFGLPLIEALHRMTPVLASDIPVLKEIGQTYCNYFSMKDHVSLNRAIDHLHANIEEVRSFIKGFSWLSWEEATDQLINKVINMVI